MDISLGTIVAITMGGTPLLIILWLLYKLTNVHIHKMRSLRKRSPEKRSYIIILMVLLLSILFIFTLGVMLLIIGIAPKSISSIIPMPLKIFYFITLSVIYGVFISIFVGLKDVARAGGSTAGIMNVLFNYLEHYFNIKLKEENDVTNEKVLKDNKDQVPSKKY